MKLISPVVAAPGAISNQLNIDLIVETLPDRQSQSSLLSRMVKIIRLNTNCCIRTTAIVTYACIFFLAPLSILFTGFGLNNSSNEETSVLGKKMIIGGTSGLLIGEVTAAIILYSLRRFCFQERPNERH